MKPIRHLPLLAILLFFGEFAHCQTRNTTVTITVDSVYETMEGFGAFDLIGTLISNGMSSANAYDMVANDLGASIMRLDLAADYETSPGVFSMSAMTQIEGTVQNTWDHAKALYALGVTRFLATPWSPPAFMKYNGNVICNNGGLWNNLSNGIGPTSDFVGGLQGDAGSANPYGSALPDEYPAFAQNILAYCQNFKTYTGFDLYAVGLQNEPEFCEPYNSATLNAPQWRDLIGVVGPVLKKANVPTKIIGPEDMGGSYFYSRYFAPLFTDNNKYTDSCKKYLDVFAVHDYLDGSAPDMGNAPGWTTLYETCHKYGKELWMTETSGYSPTAAWNDGSTTCPFAYAQSMYLALRYGRVSGWIWWGLADPSADQYSLIGGTTPEPMYYISKQYYKYIKPGAVQVKSTSSDVRTCPLAFWDASKSRLTIVLTNNSDTSEDVTLSMKNLPSTFGAFQTSETENAVSLPNVTKGTITIPPYSITTLYSTSGTAIEEEGLSKNDFQVYPDPATDHINIEIPDNDIKTITIIDVTGRVVLEEQVTLSPLTVNTSALPSGIYFIIAKGNNEVYKSRFTIK
jgi:O-glycosyl hydrolase